MLCGCLQVLIGLVRSYRYDKELVDPSIANKESAILRETIRTKHLDSDNFLLILSTRNVHQLRETFECYKQNYGFSIDQVTLLTSCLHNLLNSATCAFFSYFILSTFTVLLQDMKSCGKGLLESILKVVIWCIDSPEKHFAEVLLTETDSSFLYFVSSIFWFLHPFCCQNFCRKITYPYLIFIMLVQAQAPVEFYFQEMKFSLKARPYISIMYVSPINLLIDVRFRLDLNSHQ